MKEPAREALSYTVRCSVEPALIMTKSKLSPQRGQFCANTVELLWSCARQGSRGHAFGAGQGVDEARVVGKQRRRRQRSTALARAGARCCAVRCVVRHAATEAKRGRAGGGGGAHHAHVHVGVLAHEVDAADQLDGQHALRKPAAGSVAATQAHVGVQSPGARPCVGGPPGCLGTTPQHSATRTQAAPPGNVR